MEHTPAREKTPTGRRWHAKREEEEGEPTMSATIDIAPVLVDMREVEEAGAVIHGPDVLAEENPQMGVTPSHPKWFRVAARSPPPPGPPSNP